MSDVYIGFEDEKDMLRQFNIGPVELEGATVLLAWYGLGHYEGRSFVLFEKGGKLYEVNESHCSCHGLEDGWFPEETSWEALALTLREGTKFYAGYDDASAGEQRLRALVDARVPPEKQER